MQGAKRHGIVRSATAAVGSFLGLIGFNPELAWADGVPEHPDSSRSSCAEAPREAQGDASRTLEDIGAESEGAQVDTLTVKPDVEFAVFHPDGPEALPDVWYILSKGECVGAFASDGTAAFSGREMAGMESIFLGTDGKLSRFALKDNGKETGLDVIVEPSASKEHTRLTFVDADANVILQGTLFGEVAVVEFGAGGAAAAKDPISIEGEKNLAAVIFGGSMYILLESWCIHRCDRCTDTCDAGKCDQNACGDCFAEYCDTP